MNKNKKRKVAQTVTNAKKPKLESPGIEDDFEPSTSTGPSEKLKLKEPLPSSDEEDIEEVRKHYESKCSRDASTKVLKIIEHLLLRPFDMGFTIIDEIALEGLDGITLEGLWKRIGASEEGELILTSVVKSLIWNIICSVKEIEFFLLNEPRAPLIVYEESNNLDLMKGVKKEMQPSQDIYPTCIINDPASKIIGSCATYSTRQNVTENIKMMPLSSAETYGNRLVLVASHKLRKWALFGPFSDPNLELLSLQYCLLERIGRSRKHGETNLHLQCKDAKQMFYLKKILEKNRLIIKQPMNRSSKGSTTGPLTLSRFYNETKMRWLLITEHIVSILKQMPQYRLAYNDLMNILGFRIYLKRLNKIPEFKKFISTKVFLYREMYPDAAKSEWKTKGSQKERKIKTLVLKDPNINIQAGWVGEVSESESEEEENGKGIAINRTILSQALDIVFQKGQEGVSVMELKKLMNVDYYTARLLLRVLEKRKLIDMKKVDDYRQHRMRYYMRCCSLPEIASKHDEIVKKVKGEKVVKKGYAVMSKLLTQTDEDDDETPSNSPPPETKHHSPVQVIHLLTVSPSFSKKLRESGFKHTEVDNVEEQDVPIEHLNIIQHNIFKRKFKQKSEKIGKTPKMDELQAVRLHLIQALLSGQSGIWPSLQQTDSNIPLDVIDSSAVAKDVHIETEYQKNRKQKQAILMNSSLMGCSPLLEATYLDSDGVTVEIISSTRPKQVKREDAVYRPLVKDKTMRFIRRANQIIKIIRKERITTIAKLRQTLFESELEEGHEFQVDKKSIIRIVQVLICEGFVKAYQVVVVKKPLRNEQWFICTMDVEADDEQLTGIVKTSTGKLQLAPTVIPRPATSKRLVTPPELTKSLLELKELNRAMPHGYKPSRVACREYGFAPKFVRMQVLHELLFYLAYDFEKEKVPTHTPDSLRQYFTEEEFDSLPKVYNQEIGWKMFIPPLPEHKDCAPGMIWFLDVLLRLPLSLFVKLHGVKFVVPELYDYLDHPVKKHLLIKHLPDRMRGPLVHRKAYMSNNYYTLCQLCRCGLLQINRKANMESTYVFFYVNRRALLFDTTTSGLGYQQVTVKQYEVTHYIFNSLMDVKQYWYQLWSICMATPLGFRKSSTKRIHTTENVSPKISTELTCLNAAAAMANDVGYIPGDNLGAGGLDSNLWPHLRHNWIWGKRWKDKATAEATSVASLENTKLENVTMIRFEELEQMRKEVCDSDVAMAERLKRIKQRNRKRQVAKAKALVKCVKQPKKRKRVVYYDKIDKAILRKTHNIRSKWSKTEDQFLKLCRVAVCFFCPQFIKNLIPYTALRDVAHRLIPQSRTKTSRACQRRTAFLFNKQRNPDMNPVVEAENLMMMPFVRKYFKKFRDRIKEGTCSDNEKIVAFIYLVYYLFKNKNLIDSTNVITKNFLTPENVTQIIPLPDKGSKTTIYKEPKEWDDLKINFITSVIHSSVGSSENTMTNAYRFYSIYKMFPEGVLKTAFDHFKQTQLISVKKSHVTKKQQRKSLIFPIPYQFSASYIYRQMTDYPMKAFEQAYDLVSRLEEFAQWVDGESLDQGHNLAYSEIMTCVNVNLMFETVEETLRLNPQIEDHSELIKVLAERYILLLKKKRAERTREASKKREDEKVIDKKNKRDVLEATIEGVIEKMIRAYDCGDDEQRQALQKSIDVDLQNLEGSPEEEEEEQTTTEPTEKEKQTTAFEPEDAPQVFSTNDNQNLPSLEEIMEGMMEGSIPGEKRKVPHITELAVLLSKGMFAEGEVEEDEELLDRLSKHFVMVLPKLKIQMPQDVKQKEFSRWVENIKEKSRMVIEHIKNDNVFDNLTPSESVIEEFLDKDAARLMNKLVSFIRCKQEFGATADEIKDQFGCTANVRGTLKFLVEKHVILQTGITCIRFVHYEYKQSWFLKRHVLTEDDIIKLKAMQGSDCESASFSANNEQNGEKLIKLAPWFMITGKINVMIFKKWIGILLSHCMKYPKISFNAIAQKFCYLKPVDIFSLLECLQELECVKMMAYKCETSILSVETKVDTDEVSFLHDFDDIYVTVSSTAAIRLGCFISVLEFE